MSRLAVLAIILLVVVNAGTALFAKSVPSRRIQNAGNEITLIYVGAKNCSPCDIWARDHRDAFLDSPERNAIAYHEVIAASLSGILSNEAWPVELRRYRDTAKDLRGAPAWLLIEGDRVIASVGGLSNWNQDVVPFLKKYAH